MKEDNTLAELAKEYGLAPSTITEWKTELMANASQTFTRPEAQKKDLERLWHNNEKLLKKVGQLTLEVDFLQRQANESALAYPLKDLACANENNC